jgi:coenzyme Q-binding protein COQ10
MPKHFDSKRLPYRVEQLFDLVADVGSYPQFVPWIVGARVTSRSDTLLVADLIVGFKMFRERFTSKVKLDRPHVIHVDYVSGPLKYLHNEWRFEDHGDGSTTLHFEVDFEFRSRMFETLVGALFGEAVRRMVSAFEARAAALYGRPTPEPAGLSNASAPRTA